MSAENDHYLIHQKLELSTRYAHAREGCPIHRAVSGEPSAMDDREKRLTQKAEILGAYTWERKAH